MTTVVVVPFRSDRGQRDRLWRFLKDTYWRDSYVLLVGDDDGGGPFNRSAAINAAAGSCDWSVMVVADADTWVDPWNLRAAISLAETSGRLVAAFDTVVELDLKTTEAILCGDVSLSDTGRFTSERVRTKELETQSSMIVVPRSLWDRVQFDARFVGWGGEDNAYWKACTLVAGEPQRIKGSAFHLWHPAAEGKHFGFGYQRNLRLWRRYEAARTVKDLKNIQ